MVYSKNSPPRKWGKMAAALHLMAGFAASTPELPPEAPTAAQLRASAEAIDNGLAAIARLNAQLSAESGAQHERMATGAAQFCAVRDAIYHHFGKTSEHLLKAGLKICDVKPTDAAQPPRVPAIKSLEEISPDAVRIRIENVPRAKDYKYFIGTTSDTASMTLLDTSTKKTFVYEGLKEGVKYFFAVKARNTAGESEFSAVASRWMY